MCGHTFSQFAFKRVFQYIYRRQSRLAQTGFVVNWEVGKPSRGLQGARYKLHTCNLSLFVKNKALSNMQN